MLYFFVPRLVVRSPTTSSISISHPWVVLVHLKLRHYPRYLVPSVIFYQPYTLHCIEDEFAPCQDVVFVFTAVWTVPSDCDRDRFSELLKALCSLSGQFPRHTVGFGFLRSLYDHFCFAMLMISLRAGSSPGMVNFAFIDKHLSYRF